MKRKIFLQILGATAVSLVLLFVAGIVITHLSGRQMIRQRLKVETNLVTELLNDEAEFSAFEKYYNNDELRVTIISMDGEVKYESDDEASEENHLDREEVQAALNGESKAVERYSETFACEMTYYAMKGELSNGTEVIVRLAVRSSEVSSYLLPAFPFLIISLIVTMVIASVFANKLSRGVAERINEVGDSLKSLNAGQYKPLKTDMREPEFYSVFNEINELNESTHEHIRREESEHIKLNTVLDNVSQGIVALNKKREIEFVNDSALSIFGVKGLAAGRTLSYLIEDTRFCEKLTEGIEKGDFRFEYDYKEKTLAVTGKRIQRCEAGNARALSQILIFTDVTREKEIIRQKSDFFANASHELKTPITVMRGLTEILLSKEAFDDAERKQIERIHKESLRMASLISDMLKLSKLERGEVEERMEVCLKEIASEVIAELSEEAKAKALSVELKVTGECKVLADPKKMFELMQNLCSNAVNYNKEGGFIRVDLTETEHYVALQVTDSGIGIEKEHIPRLCERFYRVDKSRSKKTGGTGLGLAIVKHICALYKAELSIESELGKGTRVSVIFTKNVGLSMI